MKMVQQIADTGYDGLNKVKLQLMLIVLFYQGGISII